MTTSQPIEKVVADANVLLSAVIGKAARRVFTETLLSVATTVFNQDEVNSYLPHFAEKYDIGLRILQYQFAFLPLELFAEKQYSAYLPEAKKRIGKRDPDDIHLLALALRLNVPIWSNDRDFEQAGVAVYSTAQLLRVLGL